MLANFVEVWLAKEGHDGVVGINLLTKVQMPNLASLYGAMLAGVDYVLMGAGIPREIPGVLDALARARAGAAASSTSKATPRRSPSCSTFDPREHWAPHGGADAAALPGDRLGATRSRRRWRARRAGAWTASSSRARPPAATTRRRAASRASTTDGEPMYGERDRGGPREDARARASRSGWLAARASPEPCAPRSPRGAGSAGRNALRLLRLNPDSPRRSEQAVLAGIAAGAARVRTDPRASPTGYPFKVVEVGGTRRARTTPASACATSAICARPIAAPTGKLGYRCPAEPVEAYVAKGGDVADTVGRRCLCNGLTANIGLAQRRERRRRASAGHERRRSGVDRHAREPERGVHRRRRDRASPGRARASPALGVAAVAASPADPAVRPVHV